MPVLGEFELIWHAVDDLRTLADTEVDNLQMFSVGGPFLPRPAAGQAPIVIIPAIRFSAGADVSSSFNKTMVDRAVEAASFLITFFLKQPALIYPWIRISPCAKA